MEPVAITDPADPRVADYFGLRDPEHRRRVEGDRFFIAEGATVIERLLTSRYRVRSVLVTPRRFERMEPMLRPLECPVFVADRDVLQHVAGFDLHRGAVAAAERGAQPSLADVLQSFRTLVLLEGLTDAENLGAIARSARGLGVDAVVLDPTCADPFYRRTVRVSMGEILFIPVVRSSGWQHDLSRIAGAGFRLIGLTPNPSATSLRTLVRSPGDRFAIVLGTEGPGLSETTLARCERVRIPLRDGTDSLNVGHAAAIAFAALVEP